MIKQEGVIVHTKLCFICEIEKDVSEFYANKHHRDGLLDGCKKCNGRIVSKGKQCPGCINHAPGQRDHMGPGGCLYQE